MSNCWLDQGRKRKGTNQCEADGDACMLREGEDWTVGITARELTAARNGQYMRTSVWEACMTGKGTAEWAWAMARGWMSSDG